MFGLLKRDTIGVAQVVYAGFAPPPAEAFGRLRDLRIEVSPMRPPADALWGLELRHPDWGAATIAAFRDTPPASELVRFAVNLSDAEKAAIGDATSAVILQVPARRGHVLADRKTLLRFARALLGEDGVVAVDLASNLPWGRAALDDELAHDADFDIEALYCLHRVVEGDGERGDEPSDGPTPWLHTHGLAEIGTFDIDVVDVHPSFVEHGSDLIRSLAFAALAGEVRADTDRFRYAPPDRQLRFVPVDRFMREAAPAYAGLRDAPGHDGPRAVLCEPSARKILGFGRGDRPEPLALARRPFPDPFVALFSADATSLMAERARATVPVLRSLVESLAEFRVQALVKLGYPTPDGSKEHLWFEIHGFADDAVDATLVNRPIAVDLREGERSPRPLDLLTDWTLITPAGWVTPRSQHAVRLLWEHADEIREAMRAAGA
jgi:hypothetical protein